MELIKIVDENGEFTGTIMEREKAHELNLLHWEVGVFVINEKMQALLQRRSKNKKIDPNVWSICGGHVNADEEPEMTAIRELREEIGLRILNNDLHIFGDNEVKIRESNSHIVKFYYVICNKKEEEFTIQKEELSEIRWLDIDKIIEMIKANDKENMVFGRNKEKRIYQFEELKKIIIDKKRG